LNFDVQILFHKNPFAFLNINVFSLKRGGNEISIFDFFILYLNNKNTHYIYHSVSILK